MTLRRASRIMIGTLVALLLVAMYPLFLAIGILMFLIEFPIAAAQFAFEDRIRRDWACMDFIAPWRS